MAGKTLPIYPVYVPSKGRYETCFTAKFLIEDEVPFFLVIEPSEYEHYFKAFGGKYLLVMPKDNMRLLGAGNWIRDHAEAAGHARHWQLDDNIRWVSRRYQAKRLRCNAGVALRVCEEFTDRYTNIGISGMNYEMFAPGHNKMPPYYLNNHVYSCSLINHTMPIRWRLYYNDDTDICLQALSQGWCTVLFNIFLIAKMRTMDVKGGNTADLYQGDGRLKMSKALERLWPGVVTTDRRFQRPQHVIKDQWRGFDTPLIRRKDIDWDNLKPNEYGMELTAVKQVKSKELKDLLTDYKKRMK